MESFATPYQVVFYDGEQEHDKGVVGVHSVLTFKRFQVLMSQKTGIPANQLSAVFVCRRTVKDDKQQKLPINENTNFNIILNQHNPSREKDCHFLVSIKKSKKERKVIRKRSTEAENGDDEDSNSSRGDLSPSDERPKPGSGTDDDVSCSLDATSPPIFVQRPSSPVTPVAVSSGQRVRNGSPDSKLSTAAPEGKVERTLLRREGMGPNGFASPKPGWQYGGGRMGQIEGFSIPSTGRVDELAQVQNAEDHQKLHNGLPWMYKEGMESARRSEKANDQAALQQLPAEHHLQLPLMDLCLKNRFDDSQSPGLRPSNSGTRNGMIPSIPNVAPDTATNLLNNLAPFARPSFSISSIGSSKGNFLPRVSMEVGEENRQIVLQQAQAKAQAQMSCLQQQQQQQAPVSMIPLELSNLSGVLQGLVGRDIRAESTKTCKLCCFCQERNIREPAFHWCVDDTILMGFRGPSPAGPIGRPGKWHMEAAA